MARSLPRQRKTSPQRLILDSGGPRRNLRGGARDAPVHRVRNAVDVFPTDERMGCSTTGAPRPWSSLAGTLLGDAGRTNTVDAMVASEAVLAEADVLTADPDDLRPLLAGFPGIQVIPV